MDRSFRLGEAGHIDLPVGPHLLGYRADATDLHAAVRDLFPGATGGGAARPNLSVLVGDAHGATRAKSVLYVNNVRVVATTSRGRLLRAMVRGVEHTVATLDATFQELPGTVLVRGGSLVFVDAAFGPGLRDEEARLRRSGWKVWDAPAVLVDLSTGHLVGPPPVGSVDRGNLAAVTAADPVRPTELTALEPVAARDVTWVVPHVLQASPAGHVLGLMRSRISGRRGNAAQRLSSLASFVAQGRHYHSQPGGGRRLLSELEHLIG